MIKFKLDPGAYAPERAHETDAGWDLKTPQSTHIPGHSHITIDTGVHIEIPKGCVGILKSKSGLNVRHNITSDGVIDAGYTGSIRVKLYNLGGNHYFFKAGDKITQIVILPINTEEMMQVETLEETERGDAGFGSSGR